MCPSRAVRTYPTVTTADVSLLYVPPTPSGWLECPFQTCRALLPGWNRSGLKFSHLRTHRSCCGPGSPPAFSVLLPAGLSRGIHTGAPCSITHGVALLSWCFRLPHSAREVSFSSLSLSLSDCLCMPPEAADPAPDEHHVFMFVLIFPQGLVSFDLPAVQWPPVTVWEASSLAMIPFVGFMTAIRPRWR